ncbi:hypothetical protein GCM10009821_04210 [Aeromicrobium halocynthiae]|uniref:Glycosyltransferase RgtA/B/C/D-like domain-containing protein n=1 Tax=Aeromicrobium halocynthiae TaxID=560557 RepID=A0ABN2VRI4_9ACTN
MIVAAVRRAPVLLWSVVLALLVGWPWLRDGLVLAYDMVWVPRWDLTRPDLWGLGSALPRAVPSDAVAAVVSSLVGSTVAQRVALFGGLLLAATGGARLVPRASTAARLAAATLAVWNPYVAERLAIGQWPMVLAYGALLWLTAELRSGRPRLHVVTLAVVGTALTPASGVMGAVVVLVLLARRGAGRLLLATALVTMANAPWWVASLLGSSLPPDPAGVELFALRGQGLLGHLGAALSLGGIWNGEVVDATRGAFPAVLLVVGVWVVAVVGLVARRGSLGPLGVLAATGLVIACAGWLAPGAMERLVEACGPAALLRDGARFLALAAPLLVVGFGRGIDVALGHARRHGLAAVPIVVGLLLPVAALPGLVSGVGGRLEPVTYPASWDEARTVVAASDVPGDLLVLPFAAYRAPEWNGSRPVLDPAGRFFPRPTVVDDRLLVDGTIVRGEDPRAAQVRVALSSDDPPRALADLGIGLVVLDTTAPEADEARTLVVGLERLGGSDLVVLQVPEVAVDRETALPARVLVGAGWSCFTLLLLVGVGGTVRDVGRAMRSSGTRARADESP